MKQFPFFLLCLTLIATISCATAERPNILWITSEDNGPVLGAYGDTFADTPNLDRLAADGMIYTNAWSNAPVCAPARTTIISGVYAPSLGAEHMRSMVSMPPFMKMYPQLLREAGYYCTNNHKEDYNLVKPGKVWDDSSKNATWRNRPRGEPFFAIFNLKQTHESQIRKRPHTPVHDPSKVRVPAYMPDTPEVRLDWAQYYDQMTEMDAAAGKILQQLEEDGLADKTIIFYYGDHGPGMPRSKRWPYNSGLSVPLIVRIPARYRNLAPAGWKAGGSSDRLVSFVDLAPTLLSLIGVKPPEWMQGHAFLGKFATPEPPYEYGFRGRMDERYDMVRSVRDKRYIYIRNYMPHKIYGQYVAYMFQTPSTRVWKRLYDEGKLKPPQTFFWETKPPEELYDLKTDPDETRNLATSPDHQEILALLRAAQREKALEIRDLGFLPENEIHTRSAGSTPYEMGHNDQLYPMEKIMATAEMASSLKEEATGKLVKALADPDSAVRYWAAMGLLMRGGKVVAKTRKALLTAMGDASPSVRIIAAEALGRYGTKSDATKALAVLLQYANPEKNGIYLSMLSLNAIDSMDDRATPARKTIAALPDFDPKANRRLKNYALRLKEKILADLK